MRTRATCTFGACVTEMPLSSSRDMSVSISPWRCAHRRRRWSRRRDSGGGCAVSFSIVACPLFCVPPLRLIFEEKGAGCNQDAKGRKGERVGEVAWTCLQSNKGMVAWPRLFLFYFFLLSVTPSPLFYLYVSEVQWLRSSRLAGAFRSLPSQYLFILSPQRILEMEPTQQNRVCEALPAFFVFSKAQAQVLTCLTCSQFSRAHLLTLGELLIIFSRNDPAKVCTDSVFPTRRGHV